MSASCAAGRASQREFIHIAISLSNAFPQLPISFALGYDTRRAHIKTTIQTPLSEDLRKKGNYMFDSRKTIGTSTLQTKYEPERHGDPATPFAADIRSLLGSPTCSEAQGALIAIPKVYFQVSRQLFE